jgi:S-adenosylmethionine:tRNA ribosyltransferase-isomerase
MLRGDFHYELPPELIAQYPAEARSGSRLLTLDGNCGAVSDRLFTHLPELLQAGDLLVFNDTRVIPARLQGRKDSGGKVEVLVERLLDDQHALAQLRASKPPQPGSRLHLDGDTTVTVLGRRGEFFELHFAAPLPVSAVLEKYGHVPLPPYIARAPDRLDGERYQTVYARHPGAVAAPTAGLHFDRQFLDRLTAQGINQAFVTLHVGAGSFQPVRAERIADHVMHGEIASVTQQTCEQIRTTRSRGGRIVAVGTTSLRALETACQGGEPRPFQGETRLFIYPGYRFQLVDALLTNFHLPESTLLMLVAAFAGYENTMHAYQHAVAQGYRFFSFGDAMFVTRHCQT